MGQPRKKSAGPRTTGFVRAQPPGVGDSYRTKALKAYKNQLIAVPSEPAKLEPETSDDPDLAELLDPKRKAA